MSSNGDADVPDGGARVVDVSGLPDAVVTAITDLAEQARRTSLADASRERLGDLVQAAEAVKGFADASLLDATSALVEDVASDHGIDRDDPRYARKVAAHRKAACRAVVHEIQLLTGSTLPAARDRVRFATAMRERVSSAHDQLRAGGCTWQRARIAYAETAHLDPVLAGQVIERLLAPPDRTTNLDGGVPSVPLSHNGFRARIRRQLALVDGAKADRARKNREAVEARDACTFPGRDGTATFQASGDAARVLAAQQRINDLAKAARAAGDKRPLSQLRADIAVDLLISGTVPGHEFLGDAPAGRLHVIVPFAALLPDDTAQQHTTPSTPGAAFGLGEVPGLGFLTPEQVRAVAFRAGSTWLRMVTDPVTGEVIDAANTYRPPAAMARLVQGRDHTCRAPGDCGVSAHEADLDHDVEHQPGAQRPADGATHPDNLHAVHRGHHNAKTHRFWASRQHDDASITWHTLTRRLRTTPFDHHRPDDQCPPWVSRAEQRFGIQLALCREHDVIPNVFTDLDDLQLLQEEHEDRAIERRAGCNLRIYRPTSDIRIELCEPKPPF
ncbi:HNH endonuclease signature motif containing protein [Flexivirga sp. B27]